MDPKEIVTLPAEPKVESTRSLLVKRGIRLRDEGWVRSGLARRSRGNDAAIGLKGPREESRVRLNWSKAGCCGSRLAEGGVDAPTADIASQVKAEAAAVVDAKTGDHRPALINEKFAARVSDGCAQTVRGCGCTRARIQPNLCESYARREFELETSFARR